MLGFLWALPNTVLGFALGAAGCAAGGRMRWVDGALEVHGRLLSFALRHLTCVVGGVAAVTLGHVVLGRDAASLAWCRAHERVHVQQYGQWGPFFLPAYAAASLWAVCRGKHPYRDNLFERVARARCGAPH